MKLSPSAMKVQEALNRFGMDCQVVELPQSTRTAQEAANTVGCELAQIVKSLVFKGLQSGNPILVLTSGANRVNENLLREVVGEPIGKADADFVRERTGFAIGGVPPVGHSEPIRTFIDEDLMAFDEVWAAAGTPNAVFRLTTSDLRKITEGAAVIAVHS